MSAPARAALALSLATLFFARQIASWSVEENRYLYHWRAADSAYLIGAVAVVAVLVFLTAEAVRRLVGGRERRLLHLAFALVLGQLLLAVLLAPDAEKPREGAMLASLLMAGTTVYAFRRAGERVVRAARTVALVAVPMGPILFLQILSWEAWPECGPPKVGPPAAAGARPTFVLLFDEWSLARSQRDGEFLPELVHLRRLAARATVYSEARSPADATRKAIPRLLYQENGEIVAGDGEASWDIGDTLVQAEDRPNLFSRARARGYRTELVGWYLPYGALVGDDLDGCRVWSQTPKREGAARLLDLTWANLRYLPDPLSRLAWRELYAQWFSAHWYALERRVESEAIRLAREAPSNTLAFVHFPLPHGPFVFEADGGYDGPFEEGRMEGTPAEYLEQIRYLDAVLGRFLKALEAAGRLDSAVVVVTSDHSWKRDPERRERTRERLRRVPLMVMGGGAGRGRADARGVCLLDLVTVMSPPAPGVSRQACTAP